MDFINDLSFRILDLIDLLIEMIICYVKVLLILVGQTLRIGRRILLFFIV